MATGSDQQPVEPRRVTRRQMIAGTGLAAAAWAAPSIVHIDVASAAGTGAFAVPSTVTVGPSMVPPACVTLNVDPSTTTSIAETPTIGPFGAQEALGSSFVVTVTGVPMGTLVSLSMELCFRNTWESADVINVTLAGMSGAAITPPAPPIDSTVRCESYPGYMMATHGSSGPVILDLTSTANAQVEEFGVANVTLSFS